MLKIPFLRHILLLSLLITIGLPLYDRFVSFPAYQEILVRDTEDEAARYVRYLTHTLGLDGMSLERGRIPPAINHEVELLRKDSHLIKFRLFSPEGEIIFSTQSGEVGTLNRKDYFRHIVARGKTFSKTVSKNEPTADGPATTRDVVETYVPIMGEDGFAGAVELYYDITASSQRLAQHMRLSTLLQCALSLGLLGLMVLVLIRAWKSFLEREAAQMALQRTNEELEERVAARTRELLKTNHLLEEEVSERQRTEKALVQALGETELAKEKIHAILSSVSDGLLVVDTEARVVLMNHAAERLLDIPRTRALGEPLASVVQIAPLIQKLQPALAEDQGDVSFDFELPHPQTPRVFRGRVSALKRQEDAPPIGRVILFHDITEQRQVEKMKSDFLAMVAHELNTPLAAIFGYSELLTSPEGARLSADEKQEFLGFVHEKTESLIRLVDDILETSRIESGQELLLQHSYFDLARLLKRTLDRYRSLYPGRRFELDLPAGEIRILADRERIAQVLENLLSNAVKYSPPEGLIRVCAESTDGQLQVVVTDEGIGMTPEQLGRAFERFYRGDTSDSAVRGTGLGLSIARHIVEAHRGKLTLASDPGRGTTARLWLTLHPPELAAGAGSHGTYPDFPHS